MFLTYNGISLEIEHVVSYEQTPVYDPSGVDYLYTHHRIVVRSIWNPEATTNEEGEVGAVAMADLRSYLLLPRKLLTFDVPSDGGTPNNVITSPWRNPSGVRYPCDANNGPKPIGVPIISVVGQKTIIVDFAIETWINECTGNRPLLSHRWEMAHDIDQDFYTTRTVTGVAIFRADWLASRGAVQISPDDFRVWLVHPIPNNFQRKRIRVETSADNTTLKYTFVDVEQPANIRPEFQRISRIEATTSTFVGQAEVSFAPGMSLSDPVSIITLGMAGFTFPRQRGVFNIRMWGRRAATREDLGNAMGRILATLRLNGASLFGGAVPIPSFFFQTMNTTMDMFNRYMEVTVVVDSSMVTSILQQIIGVGPWSFNGDPTTLEPVTTRSPMQTSNPIRDGASGDWMQRCVSQVLMGACSTPTVPPDQTSVLNTLPFYVLD